MPRQDASTQRHRQAYDVTSAGLALVLAAAGLSITFAQLAGGGRKSLAVTSVWGLAFFVAWIAGRVERRLYRALVIVAAVLLFGSGFAIVYFSDPPQPPAASRPAPPGLPSKAFSAIEGADAPEEIIPKDGSVEFFEGSTPLMVAYKGVVDGVASLRSTTEAKECENRRDVLQRVLLFVPTTDPVANESARVWLRVTVRDFNDREVRVRAERLIGYYARDGDSQCNGP